MREDIRFFVFAVSLGTILMAYAHANFATKYTAIEMREDIREVRSILWEIKKVIEKNR